MPRSRSRNAPQVYPSPLRVSLRGFVEIRYHQPSQTAADVVVESIIFTIPVGSAQDTLTAGAIQATVSNPAWSVAALDDL